MQVNVVVLNILFSKVIYSVTSENSLQGTIGDNSIHKEPHRLWINVWVLAGVSVYVFAFEIYQGATVPCNQPPCTL